MYHKLKVWIIEVILTELKRHSVQQCKDVPFHVKIKISPKFSASQQKVTWRYLSTVAGLLQSKESRLKCSFIVVSVLKSYVLVTVIAASSYPAAHSYTQVS